MKNLFCKVTKACKYCLSKSISLINKLFLVAKANKIIVGFLISVLPLIYLSYFYIYHVRIIVNEIILPESLVSGGINPRNITEISVAGIHQSGLNHLKGLHENTSSHRINKSTGASECIRSNIEVSGADDLFSKMTTQVYTRSEIPDIDITSHKFSLSSIIFFLKKRFGWPYLEISSSLNITQGGYLLKVHASSENNQHAYIKRFLSSDKDLSIALTESLLNLVSPEIFAMKEQAFEPSDIDFELHVAKNVLKDKNKTALILMMQMDSFESSRTNADDLNDKYQANLISKEIQNNYNLSFLKDYQYAAKLNLVSSQAQYVLLNELLIGRKNRPSKAEVFKKLDTADEEFQKKYKEINIKEFFMSDGTRKELEQLRMDADSIYESSGKTYLDDLFYGYVLSELHNLVKPLTIYKELFEKIKTDQTLSKQTRGFFKVNYMQLLIAQNKFNDLKQFVQKEKYGNPNFRTDYQNQYLAYFNAFEATMLLRKKQHDMAVSLLKDASLAKYPCIELGLTGQLKNKKEYFYLINERLNMIEKKGFYNSKFYNNWGSLLVDMGKYKESYGKYKASLLYPGDKAWILLNWGRAANLAHDYELSIQKYRESLENGLVFNAVSGLLASLSESNKSKEYLIEYKRYFDYLDEHLRMYHHDNLKTIFSQWAYTHHCRINDNSELMLLTGKPLPGLDTFDSKICGWRQHESKPVTTQLH